MRIADLPGRSISSQISIETIGASKGSRQRVVADSIRGIASTVSHYLYSSSHIKLLHLHEYTPEEVTDSRCPRIGGVLLLHLEARIRTTYTKRRI
jgi:hypothetical protein